MDKPYGEETCIRENGNSAPDGAAGGERGFEEKRPPGFLEIIYGVLFEPAQTMAGMAQRPPLVQALLAVTLAGLAGSMAFSLALYRLAGSPEGLAGVGGAGAFWRVFLPAGAVMGLFWSYIKWAGISALLHLVAELLGGRGTARAVMAATGFAAIPSLFLAPVEFLASWSGHSYVATVILLLAGIAVSVWTLALLVIALKELHGISVLRALLAVFSPLLAIFLLVLALFMALGTAAVLIPSRSPYFPTHF